MFFSPPKLSFKFAGNKQIGESEASNIYIKSIYGISETKKLHVAEEKKKR